MTMKVFKIESRKFNSTIEAGRGVFCPEGVKVLNLYKKTGALSFLISAPEVPQAQCRYKILQRKQALIKALQEVPRPAPDYGIVILFGALGALGALGAVGRCSIRRFWEIFRDSAVGGRASEDLLMVVSLLLRVSFICAGRGFAVG